MLEVQFGKSKTFK